MEDVSNVGCRGSGSGHGKGVGREALQLQHPRVASVGVMVEQVRVRPLLHHLAVVDDRDGVRVPHRGQAVRHHDGRSP